jgi:phage terminase small subunit
MEMIEFEKESTENGDVPAPPASLSKGAKKLWRRLAADGGLDDPGRLLVLRTCLEAWDVMVKCQAHIDVDGLQVPDRFGQLKPHPLLPALRDSRAAVQNGLKILGVHLDSDDGAQHDFFAPGRAS